MTNVLLRWSKSKRNRVNNPVDVQRGAFDLGSAVTLGVDIALPLEAFSQIGDHEDSFGPRENAP